MIFGFLGFYKILKNKNNFIGANAMGCHLAQEIGKIWKSAN